MGRAVSNQSTFRCMYFELNYELVWTSEMAHHMQDVRGIIQIEQLVAMQRLVCTFDLGLRVVHFILWLRSPVSLDLLDLANC